VPGTERPIVKKPDTKIGAYEFIAGTDEQMADVEQAIKRNSAESWLRYQRLVDNGVANEVARLVLPQNTMTQFYATANPRNVMLFLTLRNELQALYEIRDVAAQIEEEFARAMPITYEAYLSEREKQQVLKRIFAKYTID